MEQELKDALEAIKSQVTEKTKGLDGLEAKTAQLIADAEAKMKTANEAEIKAVKDEFETRIDALVADMKAKKSEVEVKNFNTEFSKTLKEKENELKNVSTGNKLSFEMKDVTINTNNTLTGDLANENGGAVIRQGDAVILPTPLVNFSNLIATVTGSEDTIRIWREAATANAVASVAKGDAKPEQDFDIPPVVFTANYKAALYRFHKSMMRNLPWMQARLPQMLRRNFFKAENAAYYAALKSAASVYSGTGVGVVALVEAIAQLEAADFPVNGIVLNPTDWAAISVTRDDENGFTLPSTVTFTNGQLTINGVPVFKATFVTAGEFIVGDWTQAYKYVTDGLKVEFFEQDVDNVQKNAITTRIEESNVLVIEQPLAFVRGELDGTPPSV
jgi:HK97 family phage major capsid protein